jgi:hypothetical protein
MNHITINELLENRIGAILMPDVKSIMREWELTKAAIKDDGNVLAKAAAEATLEKLNAKARADALLAQHHGDRSAASFALWKEAMQQLYDYIDRTTRESDELLKTFERRIGKLEADTIWRQTPRGRGQYSDVALFKSQIN